MSNYGPFDAGMGEPLKSHEAPAARILPCKDKLVVGPG